MVAVLIIAGMAGLWFQTVSETARAQRGLADRRLAMLVAQSQIATVGVLGDIAPGVRTGSDAGMAYAITISPAGDGLSRVAVAVNGADGAPLARLETLKAGQ
jgi:hypothetical protein